LKDGRKVDFALCDAMIEEELKKVRSSGDAPRQKAYEKAARLMREIIRAPRFVEFLTVPAYQQLLRDEGVVA
jgi:malate synthase